jgi:hypothetical protein
MKAAKADNAEAEVAFWDAEFVAVLLRLKDLPIEKLAKSCEGLRRSDAMVEKKHHQGGAQVSVPEVIRSQLEDYYV